MVSQGALRLLTDITQHSSDKAVDAAALALSRIAVTTDPHAFPSGVVWSMLSPIIKMITRANHELYQFEGTLALTNLASFDSDVANAIMRAGGWHEMLTLLGADNERLQKAALQCMCNLVTSEAAILRLRGASGEAEVRLFVVFAQSDDREVQCAATGALAMIAHDEIIAKHIAKAWRIDKDEHLSSSADKKQSADTKSAPPAAAADSADSKAVTTAGDGKASDEEAQKLADLYKLNVLQVLFLSPQTDRDVKIRCAAALKHMKSHKLYDGPC